jgi:hypothetical protein
VTREWLKPVAAYYATACPPDLPRRYTMARLRDPNRPTPLQMPQPPYTAINTPSSGSSVVVSAWTGDVPLFPDGFESDHLAHGMKIAAGTPVFFGA